MKEIRYAERTAHTVMEAIAPLCERLHVAGSIRRRKAVVKDIEIVADVPTHLRSAMAKILADHGTLVKGQSTGRYMQWQLNDNIALDLFLPQPHDYWRQFVIRTGSAEYIPRIVAAAWVRHGWVGTDDGLRRRDQCEKYSGGWRVKKVEASSLFDTPSPVTELVLPPVWESEEAFFKWLGIQFIRPENRI